MGEERQQTRRGACWRGRPVQRVRLALLTRRPLSLLRVHVQSRAARSGAHTISGVVHLAPRHACGTALTLWMTGNRIGRIVFPALAGMLAQATGVAGILLALGLGLAVSGIAVAARPPTTGGQV
jgi:hypothetical protein